MAKSPLAGMKRVAKKREPTTKTVTELNLSFDLKQKLQNQITFNLRDWCHLQCDPKNTIAKRSRMEQVRKIRKWVDRQLKNQISHDTIYTTLNHLQRYIVFCDTKEFDPFSKAGYLSYCGNRGELRRLVDLANEPKTYIFQYHDGEEIGLKETKASHIKIHVDKGLKVAGFNVSAYQATLHGFENGDRTPTTKPYSPQEWRLMLRRATYCYNSLATQLITYRDANPDAPPPSSLKAVVDEVDGKEITVTISGDNGAASPFDQCMFMGYLLFGYYTAFNTSTILDIRFPIRKVEQTKAGRTQKYVQVKGYKGRAAKDVHALFASQPDESKHSEATDEGDTGFIVADISKRDKNGIQDGLTYIETMKLFSRAYNNDKHGRLFYSLDKDGNKRSIDRSGASMYAAQRLAILSDSRTNLIDHVIQCYTDMIDKHQMNKFSTFTSEAGFTSVSKTVVPFAATCIKRRTIPLIYVALTCLTDVQLKNILMPLHYSDKDGEGDITVSFSYLDGSSGSFKVGAKYQAFLESVESYAQRYNVLPKGRKSVTRPPYLIPLGSKGKTFQWDEDLCPLIIQMALREYGIRQGDYFLNLNASRIRATHSDLEYKPEDNGFSARVILQHAIEIQERKYANGHPLENTRMGSQGLQALIHISKGMTRNEAINKVKQELKIPVLAYDKYIERNTPTNPNGVACEGKPDFVESKDKDWHYAARKWAEKEGVIKEGQDITCYQYDLCVFCKSAQLVDDPHSIYKLLSFLEAMSDAIDTYPDKADFIESKINRFKLQLDNLPSETLNKAEEILCQKKRYFLFQSPDSVRQYLS
ncbi:hypothetical protein AB4250_03370 [Vibrio cyclitrophicus]|nr:Site-specific integrase [Vibrio crassostreae]